jgi:hypothetical protein
MFASKASGVLPSPFTRCVYHWKTHERGSPSGRARIFVTASARIASIFFPCGEPTE